MFNDFGSLLLVICFAYGLGSIPFGLILTRLAGAEILGRWAVGISVQPMYCEQEARNCDCDPRFRRWKGRYCSFICHSPHYRSFSRACCCYCGGRALLPSMAEF